VKERKRDRKRERERKRKESLVILHKFYSKKSMENHISEVDPQDLARNLLREFLLKLNLRETLEVFNREDVRPRVKMTKIELIRYLSMERLVKNNRTRERPHETLLEVLTEYLHHKYI
jgi:predicted HAD superfamily phosphohydrolase YqeG